MRILAIGLGGAGCRIANALYANDRRSSKVTCVQALAVDVDSETLAQLRALPEQAKIGFMAVEPDLSRSGDDNPLPANIDIGEITARIQNMLGGETDAIMICCGLGGSMTDVVPYVIAAIRSSVAAPVFGLVTLPALSEGEKRSAKSADDIENIAPLLDGTILFDNETWSKKIAARRDALLAEESGGHGIFGFGKNQPKLSAQDITYKLLNQSIIRRISLILRAGEFRADGGIDLAEVVMDSSEVLNTLKGMGFISIGYAVEHLHQTPLAFLSRLRPADSSLEQRKSAERIIELAKQAIYQEVSIPCDMTSAAKALILVAGPSHEISMKGVMTVRKWIDRSIAGMEMRSGDYPVTNSEYVAIIIVLSGLENIPRLTELQDIREQYRSGNSCEELSSLNLPPGKGSRKPGAVSEIAAVRSGSDFRDEMISLPGTKVKKRVSNQYSTEKTPRYPDASSRPVQDAPSVVSAGSRPQVIQPQVPEERRSAAGTRGPALEQPSLPPESAIAQRAPRIRPSSPVITETPVQKHPISTGRAEGASRRPSLTETPAVVPPQRDARPPVKRSLESGYEGILPLKHTPAKSRDPAHQRIERELQRQQVMVKSESMQDRETGRPRVQTQNPVQMETKTIIRRVTQKAPVHETVLPDAPPATPAPTQVERTIIRRRRKETENDEVRAHEEPDDKSGPTHQEELELAAGTGDFIPVHLPEETPLGIKDRLKPARDDIFLGKSVAQKDPLRVKDAALLHTEIKTKKSSLTQEEYAHDGETVSSPVPAKKKTGKSSAQDDKISWIND
jgi:cell division GTPase FtsZ